MPSTPEGRSGRDRGHSADGGLLPIAQEESSLARQVQAEADKTKAILDRGGSAPAEGAGVSAATETVNRLDAIVREEGRLLKRLARAIADREKERWRERSGEESPDGHPRCRDVAAIRDAFVPALIRLDRALYRYSEELLRLENSGTASGALRMDAGRIWRSFACLAELNEWKWELVLDVMEEWEGAAAPAEVRRWMLDHRKLAGRIDGILNARLDAEDEPADSRHPDRQAFDP